MNAFCNEPLTRREAVKGIARRERSPASAAGSLAANELHPLTQSAIGPLPRKLAEDREWRAHLVPAWKAEGGTTIYPRRKR